MKFYDDLPGPEKSSAEISAEEEALYQEYINELVEAYYRAKKRAEDEAELDQR